MEPSSAAADLIAGFISGTVATLAVHPVDTVLTRYQSRGSFVSASAAATTVTSSTSSAVGGGPLVEMRVLAASFGPASLWRGAPALIGAAPFQNALLMAGYGAGRRWSSGNDEARQDRLPAVFVGGCVGGLLQCLVASPAELYKVRKQVLDLIGGEGQQLVRPKITSGMGATMLRDGLPHGVWFASYEWCKAYLSDAANGESQASGDGLDQSMVVPLLSGAFAASVAWGVGYPFDLIKTRIQAGLVDGVVEATRDIVARGQKEGLGPIRSLYRGFSLKLARAVPASAIGFVTYEYALGIIEGGVDK
mmetsp:Transcript_10672/g.23133  ORF Transcript_10672/g.23133 Transcript_10672/m.23133 type:complete len:306 (-) Transcript_10672:101-1018(-)